jgi:protein-S-isoprenylcysteine O-methyltransferase Ste14
MTMNNKIIEYRPPRIAMALLAIAAVLQVLIPTTSLSSFSSTTLSVATGFAGFAIMIAAWLQFRKRQVAICPTAPTAQLITDGVYRFSRNPMYLGMVMMLAGVAIYFGTLPFYAATIVYLVIMDRFFCRFEEQKLAATFPGEYEPYRSTVRRWI